MSEKLPPVAGDLDKSKVPFNPDIHQINPSKRGEWVPKKGRVTEALAWRNDHLAKNGGTPFTPPNDPNKGPIMANNGSANPGDAPFTAWDEATKKGPIQPTNPGENNPDGTTAPKTPVPGAVVAPDAPEAPTSEVPAPAAIPASKVKRNAKRVTRALEQVGTSLLSEEMAMESDDKEEIQESLEEYFTENGLPIDLPPLVNVGIAVLSWICPKLERPKVKTRLVSFWQKLTGADKLTVQKGEAK